MKNFYKILLILLFTNISFSQTQIQMPAGYGLYGPNNFVPNVAKPFYSHNGFLYCTAHTAPTGFPLSLSFFKVNESTNVVTPISTNVSIDVNSFDSPANFQVNNGVIYFLLFGSVYKIDPSNNSLSFVFSGVGAEFAILNDKIIGASGQVYNLLNSMSSTLINPENPLLSITLNNLILYNNAIYGTNTIINGPSVNQYVSRLFKVLDENSVQLLYTNPLNGIYDGFDNQRPVIFNNKLLYRFRKILNNLATNYVDSYDLNNNTINTIYEYEPINITNTHYINNNNIYFINSFGQTAVSNGISASSLTNFPILLNSTTFGFKIGTPSNGSGNNMTVLNNNKVYGLRSMDNTNTNYNIWKTDGSFHITTSINVNNGFSAIDVNNKIYFENATGNGYSYRIYQYDDTTQQLSIVVNFPGNIQSNLFKCNNSIFFSSAYANTTGLFKLDTTTLSTTNFNQNNKFSISPNPTNSVLTIQTQEKIKTINIIDLLGRKTNIINFENNKIDVSNLQNGVYFLEIATENGSQVQKIIKN